MWENGGGGEMWLGRGLWVPAVGGGGAGMGGAWCLVFGDRCLVNTVLSLVVGAWSLVTGVRCLVVDDRGLVSGVW